MTTVECGVEFIEIIKRKKKKYFLDKLYPSLSTLGRSFCIFISSPQVVRLSLWPQLFSNLMVKLAELHANWEKERENARMWNFIPFFSLFQQVNFFHHIAMSNVEYGRVCKLELGLVWLSLPLRMKCWIITQAKHYTHDDGVQKQNWTHIELSPLSSPQSCPMSKMQCKCNWPTHERPSTAVHSCQPACYLQVWYLHRDLCATWRMALDFLEDKITKKKIYSPSLNNVR